MEKEIIETQLENDIYESVLSVMILDGIGPVIGLVSIIVIIIAGVRLYRATTVPGANYIYYSMVLLVIGFLLPFISHFVFGEEVSWVYDAIVSIYSGLASLLGAYGFWLLTSYVIKTRADKPSKPTL